MGKPDGRSDASPEAHYPPAEDIGFRFLHLKRLIRNFEVVGAFQPAE